MKSYSRFSEFIERFSKVIVLLCMFSRVLWAEDALFNNPQSIKFDRLSIEQGLSQNSVISIAQDRRGFMWLGTWDGLNRYDGYHVVTYKNRLQDSGSLSSNAVSAVYEDREGVLWVGTQQGGGLNRFDYATERFSHYTSDPQNPQTLSHSDIYTIYEAPDGQFWIGTGSGLSRFDRDSGTVTRYHHDRKDAQSLARKKVYAIYQEENGALWVGTDKGLHVYRGGEDALTLYQTDPKDPESISHYEIWSIYQDTTGVIWIGTKGGLNRFVPETGKFVRHLRNPREPGNLSHSFVRTIYEDGAGRFWVGTSGGGLNLFDREAERFLPFMTDPNTATSLSGNLVTCLYEDEAGVLWIGTEGEGVNLYDRYKIKFRHYLHDPRNENSLNNNYVRSIFQDSHGSFWIGTYGGGLNNFDPVTQQWTALQHDRKDPNSLMYNVVLTLHEDDTGLLWVGTERGLQTYDRTTGEFSAPHVSTYVRTIYEDRAGTFWLGTTSGVLNFTPPNVEPFTTYRSNPRDANSLSDNRVLAILEDREGIFWFGTFGGGLNRFDKDANEFTVFRADSADTASLSHDTVTVIHEDAAGTLWIGTAGGLSKFDAAGRTFSVYTEDEGLPNNTVYGLLEDEQGNLWLSTNKGLSKFNPAAETFRNYEAKDGLQSNEFNGGAFFRNRDGEMFFGGINGYNAFYPDQVKDNLYQVPLALVDFQIFNKPVPLADAEAGVTSPLSQVIEETEQIRLSWRDSVFSFEFAGLHYSTPSENRYAYMLEGFDKEWNNIGNRRFATYTNLPGGSYTFKVKGTNSDGVWNEQGRSLAMVIPPPPWKTWWAYTLYALTVIGAFLGYILYKQAQYRRERAILDRFVPYEYLHFLGKKSILDVQLGDHLSSETMAVMFSDIRSFTTLSETMTPKENFDFVNAYLKRVAPRIRGEEGFIVKFLGDGMMAVFPNGAESGVDAAIGKLTAVKEYNVHRAEDGWKPIKVGIGVHTGHMMIGMVGEKARMQGDAFSDNVNLTARLEGLTKYYGVAFLITGETYEKIDTSRYHIRFLDNVAVKGKELPIKIYEVFDADAEDLFEKKVQILPDFLQAQDLFFKKQFSESLTLFQSVRERLPDDITTELYIERCETYIKDGVPADWDGVRKMDKK